MADTVSDEAYFQRKFSSRKRDVCILDLDSSLFVYCGEKADPIGKELATLLADIRSFLGTGVQVLSSPDNRFCSALRCNTILNVEVFRDEQSSVRVWPRGFKETIRCATKLCGEALTDTVLVRQREAPSVGGLSLCKVGWHRRREILKRYSTLSR